MPKHPFSPYFGPWAPVFEAPFSGDVTQTIEPRILSPDIAGVPEIETKVVTEVASYGTQLGKILEALQVLAKAQGTELNEINELSADIEKVKAASKDALKRDAEAALDRLQRADPGAHGALMSARNADT